MRTSLLALLILAAGGIAASPAADEARARNDALFLRIANDEGDPMSDIALVGAMPLFASGEQGQQQSEAWARTADRLLERAGRADQNLEVLAMRLMGDAEHIGSAEERSLALSKLEQASAENAFFALVLLRLPEYRDAPESSASLLHRAAQAPRFQSLMMPVARSLSQRLLPRVRAEGLSATDDSQSPSDELRVFALAISYGSAVAMPDFQPLVSTCRAAFDQLRSDCRRISARMAADADTLIDAMIAQVIRIDLADNDQERAALRQQQRKLDWMHEQGSRLAEELFEPDAGEFWTQAQTTRTEQHARVWLEQGELVAFGKAMREAQIPETPPADWRSRRERLDGGSDRTQ